MFLSWSHWFCHFFRLSPNVYKSPFPVWLSIDKLAARYRRDFLENVLKIWHEFKEICGRINKLDGMKDNQKREKRLRVWEINESKIQYWLLVQLVKVDGDLCMVRNPQVRWILDEAHSVVNLWTLKLNYYAELYTNQSWDEREKQKSGTFEKGIFNLKE